MITVPYTDRDLTFYLVVYKDVARAWACITRLRWHFPHARLVIDVDGDTDPAWSVMRDTFNAEVYYGERLFLLQHGGAIVRRAMQHHFADPQARRWMLRIDTDTDVRRRFKSMPDADYFGTFRNWRNFVQGGCIGLSRNAVCRVFELGLFDRPELANPATWQNGKPETAAERMAAGLVSFDWIVNWTMNEATIAATNWPEVISNWKEEVPQTTDCAIAHPRKDVPVDRDI